ncbi:two-component sensor histidine kinase [Prauserella sp. PE36]|uniref:histidine kinase n=1 Tax=Prauserella endophytica TaxID=1592324 RepID=A0ABY2S2V4_9PSEU|nr:MULTISPECIES: histidine kinase [Prauserella]PXY32972.1 two-component sensor histidine kinase [Prauserella coralliicola]RBM19641.1 two-component sensor histidine kinase [Prauserella sp. PE36]TKG69611.1 two-component sensor histidine kinase [Prauserella endophytica]
MPPHHPPLSRLPRWGQDAVIASGYFALGSVLYSAGLHSLLGGEHIPMWTRYALLGVLCSLLLLRRRAPGLLLCVALVPLGVDAALGVTVPMLLAFGDTLYSATLYGSRRLSRAMVTLTAVGALAASVIALLLVPDWRIAVLAIVVYVPFVAIPVWWGTDIRWHRELTETERANAAQLARIAELDRDAAVAAERARMARDLHDVIAGHLSAIALQSEAALSTTDPKAARTVLTSVRENSVSALEEMRTMIGLLREHGTGEVTAPARLAGLSRLTESARASGMRLDVHTDLDPATPLPAAVDLTAYRIAQEALTNAVKHAPGAEATLTIRHADGVLTVEVTNELTGSAHAGESGTGLLSMRERAAAVGGTFAAGPGGRGWRVHAALPVPEVAA